MKTKTLKYLMIAAGSMVIGASLVAQVKDKKEAAELPKVPPETVVLRVGESKMTAEEYEWFVSGLTPEVQSQARGPQRRRVADDLIKLKIMAAEAKRLKLDQTPKFKAQMELMRENALAGSYFQEISKDLVGDGEIKKYYDDHKGEFETVTVRHILVPVGGEKGLTEDAAKAKAADIRKRIEKGEDFGKLAESESADESSRKDGGELPPMSRGQTAPEFEKTAFGLKEGDISDPVQTQFGFHIIQAKKKGTLALEDVKEKIADTLRPQKLDDKVSELKKGGEWKLDEGFFGPPPEVKKEGGDKGGDKGGDGDGKKFEK